MTETNPHAAPGELDDVLPAVLGWTNPDTREESLRLYALDAGPSPRWAPEGGRTVERAIAERAIGGALGEDFPREGDRYLVIRVGDRFADVDALTIEVARFLRFRSYPTRVVTGLAFVSPELDAFLRQDRGVYVVPGETALVHLPEDPVLHEVAEERARQDARWGEPNHPDVRPYTGSAQNDPVFRAQWMAVYGYGIPTAARARATTDAAARYGLVTWMDVLLEEVAEALEAAALGDEDALATELVQVAAVAVKWRQVIARRKARRAEGDR